MNSAGSPLSAIPSNTDVYIDANIFVYAMLNQSNDCLTFLERCGTDINGFSDVKVLHDVMHKLMLAEAGASASKLKKDPTLIRSLTKWQVHARALRDLPIEWLSVDMRSVSEVPSGATRYGLLCGDSLIVTLMSDLGVACIASNDADFADIGLSVYGPTDLTV